MPSRSPLSAVSARRAGAGARVAPAAAVPTGDVRAYSVVANFRIGSENGTWRITVAPHPSFDFLQQVQAVANRQLGRDVVVQSARATVGAEEPVSHLFSANGGYWPVRLEARFTSSQRLSRDEWLHFLTGAFRWAYSLNWVGSPGSTIDSKFGEPGDGGYFVAAANEHDRQGVNYPISYVGGSMLELGPVAPSPTQPKSPAATRPPMAGGTTTPAPTRAGSGPSRTAAPGSDPLVTTEPPATPARSRAKTVGAIALLVGAVAAVAWVAVSTRQKPSAPSLPAVSNPPRGRRALVRT